MCRAHMPAHHYHACLLLQIVVGAAASQLPLLAGRLGVSSVDAVFIDHWKTEYLADLKNLEATGLMRHGCVVIAGEFQDVCVYASVSLQYLVTSLNLPPAVADNLGYPGAPDYVEYVTHSPLYETTMYPTQLEYSKDRQDVVGVSIFR